MMNDKEDYAIGFSIGFVFMYLLFVIIALNTTDIFDDVPKLTENHTINVAAVVSSVTVLCAGMGYGLGSGIASLKY